MAALLLIQETTTQRKAYSSEEDMHVANIQINILIQKHWTIFCTLFFPRNKNNVVDYDDDNNNNYNYYYYDYYYY